MTDNRFHPITNKFSDRRARIMEIAKTLIILAIAGITIAMLIR